MNIAIYAIAKNETSNAAEWTRSAAAADTLIALDTGSTDGTPELLRSLGVEVHEQRIKPWRFDTARNAALALVPEDVDMCLCLDLDERIRLGWREEVERLWNQGAHWISYRYIWEWQDEAHTVPAITTQKAWIHARHGFKWQGFNPTGDEPIAYSDAITIEHHGEINDYTESLSQMLAEDARNTEALIEQGACHLKAGRYAEAQADYMAYLDVTHGRTDPKTRHQRARAWICVAQTRHKMRNKSMEYEGRVFSGCGNGTAHFDGWQPALNEVTGQTIVPGTLNVQLDQAVCLPYALSFQAPGGTFRLCPITVNGYACWAVNPPLSMYPANVLEIMADCNLKEEDGLNEGDMVTVTLPFQEPVLPALLQAVAEEPGSREAWVYLADYWRGVGDMPQAYGCAMHALTIKNGDATRDEICWGDYPKQIASEAFSWMINRGG